MKSLANLSFWPRFSHFANQTFKPTTIRHAFKSTGLVPFDPDIVLDKIREKQAQRAETAFQTPSPPPLPLHQTYPSRTCLCCQVWTKITESICQLKPGEKIDSEQIQQFRSYFGVDRPGLKIDTRGHNRSGKTS